MVRMIHREWFFAIWLAKNALGETLQSCCSTQYSNVSFLCTILCSSMRRCTPFYCFLATYGAPCGPECWPAPFGTLLTIFIAVSLAICIVVTTFGNLLVLVSFVVDRQIRQPTNFFIASLAVTDVLIGTVSMPFYTVWVAVKKVCVTRKVLTAQREYRLSTKSKSSCNHIKQFNHKSVTLLRCS